MLIGAHESISGGASQAIDRAIAHGAASVQIFTRSARSWRASPLDPAEGHAFRHKAATANVAAIAHGTYLANLASADPALRTRSVKCVADELARCEALGIRSLVLHPGSHPNPQRGLRLVARSLGELHRATRGLEAAVCLEVTAGQGVSLGWRFEHLAEIFERASGSDRLGVCLDTCHLHAAGYDLKSPSGYESVFDEFDRVVGFERLRCFHLNDCKKSLGCRVDRHEEIGKGTLGLGVFRRLVNDRRFEKLVAVLETPHPERYGHSIALLSSMVRH